MAMNVGGDGQYQSEINVTPLVDVVLVLLIIFMVIVPLTMRGYDVDIPGEASAPPAEPRELEQVVLAVDASTCAVLEPPPGDGLPTGCRVRLNDDAVPVPELAQKVADTFAARAPEDRVLFLAAQDQLNYEGVIRIVDVARSGVDGLRIGFVAEN